MTTKIIDRWVEAGGLVLLCILLAASVWLNRKQYLTSLSSVEFNFQRSLELQSVALRRQIELQEAEGFRRDQTDSSLESNLFQISETDVVPACTAPLLERVSAQAADEAFEDGIGLLPDVRAYPYFEIAARRSVENSDDLYRKIAAFFNLLELEPDIQTTCCILSLLNQNTPSLSASKELFFRNMLNEKVENSAKLEHRLNELWEMAQMIDRNLTRKKGAYRTSISGKVLTISEDGLALLYHPDIKVDAPLQLMKSEESTLSSEVIPGLFAAVPVAVIEQEKTTVRRQYVTGNIIICLLVLLLSILGIGLRSARRKQRQLEVARTEFIATVSHELRTPLSLIRLHAETLTHGRVSEKRIADYHQTILAETERLTGIVNNVLDFSRLERKQLQIHPESTNLSTLCGRIIESFQSRLEKEGFLLESRIVPNMDCFTDPLAVSQILFNLLDNAIKYSDHEKSVCVELEPSDKEIILRVSDRGIGIPNPLKKHIFDEFVRSKDSTVTARRGSGIGLSVVKRLVDEMGGRIEVTDNLPQGSVFSVYLRDCDEVVSG